ncbi:MAG: PilZ domain-containing protein [Candidatus Omnitrophica bacterium]|nr:PilZ domain-containing protein [Candidatus Omnitrophota bacterium]
MALTGVERRRYIRAKPALPLRVINRENKVEKTEAVNLSPLGLCYGSVAKVQKGDIVELTLLVPNAKNPVHIDGKVVWAKDGNVGCEFLRIEEDNKNTFLKFFCELIYAETATAKKEV